MREETVKLCTQTAEILSCRVGGLNPGLFPLISAPVSTFVIGEIFDSAFVRFSKWLQG